MSKALHTLLLPALGLLLMTTPVLAQTVNYTFGPDSKVWIEGTSNKSDWKVDAREVNGFVTMNADASAENPGVEEAQLTVPTKKIKGKSMIMNRLMYGALKADDHGEISYALTTVNSITPSADDPKAFVMEASGTLTIAGETNDITMTVTGTLQDDGQVRFVGSHTMLMTDYGMKPPTAMFGSLHTGDEVVVHADLMAGKSPAGSQ